MLEQKELLLVYGGATRISGTLINSIARLGKLLYGVGQGLGSSIRRIKSRKLC